MKSVTKTRKYLKDNVSRKIKNSLISLQDSFKEFEEYA